METKTNRAKRKPLYKRRKFWAITAIATVIAVGVATYFFTQQTAVKEAENNTGKIAVYTDPNEATVLIDGKEQKKRTDATFTARLGKHKVTVQLAGYDEATIEIEVAKGETSSIEHTFTQQGNVKANEPQSEYETYRNQKYGYSIRYPSRWKVNERSAEAVVFEEASAPRAGNPEGEETAPLTIIRQANPQRLDPVAWYKAREEYPHEDQSQIKQRRVTVNGRAGYQYETPYGFVPYLITIVTNGTNAFLFQQNQDSPNRKLYDQAIQTFSL